MSRRSTHKTLKRNPGRKVSHSRSRPQGASKYDTEWPLEVLRKEFESEIKEICKLKPLQKNPRLIDELLPPLAAILHAYRGRFLDTEYFQRVEECVRSVKAAAKNIQHFSETFLRMDGNHTDIAMTFARRFSPQFFRENYDLPGIRVGALLRMLVEIGVLLQTLAAGVTFATGISDAPRKRGRPSSAYTQPAYDLILLWQFWMAEKDASGFGTVRPTPTPKRLDKLDPKIDEEHFGTKQPSTEFIGQALRMIDPKIKTSEIFTAIKKALKLDDRWDEFIRSEDGKKLLRLLDVEFLASPFEG